MQTIHVSLRDEQVEKTDRIARAMTERFGIAASRAAVIRIALDRYISECGIEFNNDEQEETTNVSNE